jgi:hypothetical protein
MTETRDDLPLTHIVLALPPWSFARLLRLITDPDLKHQRGGYQDRKTKWRTRINEPLRSIELDPDDIEWVQRQIINQRGGGWQAKVRDIFAGHHALFTRLPVKPRKRPEDRKHRKPRLSEKTKGFE